MTGLTCQLSLDRRLLSLAAQLESLAEEIGKIERQLMAWYRQSAASQRLETIPGVGIITVIEVAAVPLVRNVPQSFARRIVERHRSECVDVLCSAAIARVTDISVVLTDGRAIAADLVVAAVCVIPNTALAEEAGLAVGNGIRVDTGLCTSDPAILAAGDCASVDCGGKGYQRFETWQSAQTQGDIAGRNLAGATLNFQPPVWFWSDQFDLGLQGVGHTQGEAAAQRVLGPDAEILFYRDDVGRLVGAAGLGPGNAVAKDIKLAQKLIEAGVIAAPTSKPGRSHMRRRWTSFIVRPVSRVSMSRAAAWKGLSPPCARSTPSRRSHLW